MIGTAFGKRGLGIEALGGSTVDHLPTLSITSSASITTGGPTFSFTWAYDQEEGVAQFQYRVRISNDADTTTYYDSGWLLGAVETLAVDLDAEEVPHQSTDVTVHVSVRSESYQDAAVPAYYEITDSLAFTIDWGDPVSVITDPSDGDVLTAATSNEVTWSFSDPGKTQSAYRVRVKRASSGEVVYSSGWQSGADTSFTIPFIFNDGSEYIIGVQTKNNHGVRSGIA